MIYDLKNNDSEYDISKIRDRYSKTIIPVFEIKKLINTYFQQNVIIANYCDDYLTDSTRLFIKLNIADLPGVATKKLGKEYNHKKNQIILSKFIFKLFLLIPQLNFLEINIMDDEKLLYYINMNRSELEFVNIGPLSRFVLYFSEGYNFHYYEDFYPDDIFEKDFLNCYIRVKI